MNAKKLTTIVLTLILVFSLAACGNGSESNNEPPGTPEVAAAPVTVPDEGNGAEDENIAEEEEEEDDNGDPPFVKLLKSEQFYYEISRVEVETGNEYKQYIVRTEDKYCECYEDFGIFGRVRFIQDFSTGKGFGVKDDLKEYETSDLNLDVVSLTDHNAWTVVGTGTEEVRGEMLEYIDYSSPEELVSRCYLKDGDVYIIATVDTSTQKIKNWISYISNASGNPSPSYFEIPDDYVLVDG